MADEPELEGIDPASLPDLSISPEELAAVRELMSGSPEGDPTIELYDSEVMQAAKILNHLQDKYSRRMATHENLKSMGAEAEELFYKMGLGVTVDWIGPALKVPPEPVTITVYNRLTPFDPERQRREAQMGIADELWEQ